jgi:transposase
MLRDRNRTQTRIKSLLAFHHIPWLRAEAPGFWSKQHRETLRQMPLPEPLRPCLNALLDLLEQLDVQIRQLNRQIVALSQTELYHDRCARLRHIPGVELLTAITFLTEAFRPADFPTAEAFACHVGFTPFEWFRCQSPPPRPHHALGTVGPSANTDRSHVELGAEGCAGGGLLSADQRRE